MSPCGFAGYRDTATAGSLVSVTEQHTHAETVAAAPTAPTAARTARGPAWRSLAPGLALAGAAGLLALGVNLAVPPLSALLLAIVSGMVATNVMRLPAATAPGIAYAAKQLLRLGIVLLGFHLSLTDIAALGPGVLALVVAVVASGFATAEIVGRMLGVRGAQRTLIGAGFSICGAAAVAGVEGIIDDKEDEDVLMAIALVVVFGTLMIPLVPLAVAGLGLGPEVGGLWAGASIHEVAQVVAAAGIISPAALKVGVVVKLARVVMLAPVMLILSVQLRRRSARHHDATRPPLVPLFVLGFLLATVVRTTGLLPAPALGAITLAQTFLLATAMFGLGCGVRVATVRTLGGRPVILAAVTTLVVGGIGLGGARLLG